MTGIFLTPLVRTILLGVGLVAGDWVSEHEKNRKQLYIIEPVVESLLQVIMMMMMIVNMIVTMLFRCSVKLSSSMLLLDPESQNIRVRYLLSNM